MTTTEQFICPIHGIAGDLYTGCPSCVTFFDDPPDADMMTPDARADELRMWLENVLTVPFETLWKRVDQLVGRPTFNHELVSSDRLIEEARSQAHPTTADIISDLSQWCEQNGKPLIVVATDGD